MYIFEVSLELDESSWKVSVLYACEITSTNAKIQSAISDVVNVQSPSPKILIVCPVGLENSILEAYKELDYEVDHFDSSIEEIVILPYKVDGSLCNEKISYLHGNNLPITKDLLTQVAQSCISETLSETCYKLRPPHGYKFEKPSGKHVDVFLRTGNILSKPKLLLPFCYLLLCKMQVTENTVDTLYIDSFTIYSFALRIQSLLAYLYAHDPDMQGSELKRSIPFIEIFQSYEIKKSLRLPNSGKYFVLISASSSNDLLTKLVDDHGANRSQITHLLGIGDADINSHNEYIHFINEQVDSQKAHQTKLIGISTEEFLISHGNPICVRLTQKHVCENLKMELGDQFYQKCLYISRSGQNSGYEPYSMFSFRNRPNHGWSNGFSKWLRQIACTKMPVTTEAIIHLNDDMSMKMAYEVAKYSKGNVSEKEIPVYSSAELDNLEFEFNHDYPTVMVIGFDDPELDQFGNISRQLRSYSNLHRNFILGYAFPENQNRHERMIKDLMLNVSSESQYEFSSFLVSPIGPMDTHHSIHYDYGLSIDLVNRLTGKINLKIVERLKNGLNDCIFFPTIHGNDLKLRGGSIFFSRDQGEYSQQVVYLAVASAIQRIRNSSKGTPHEQRFDSNPFVVTVIDPDMFWRYNDGILQAAMLRVLSPSELDFASSIELSEKFQKFAVNNLSNARNENGEAAIEVIAAVASKKVSLVDNDFNIIKTKAKSDSVMRELWNLFENDRPL